MKSHKQEQSEAEMREIQPLSITPRAGLAPQLQFGFNTKAHREKPSPLCPRNLRGEAGPGTAPGESLQETMDVLRDREKGKRKTKIGKIYYL